MMNVWVGHHQIIGVHLPPVSSAPRPLDDLSPASPAWSPVIHASHTPPSVAVAKPGDCDTPSKALTPLWVLPGPVTLASPVMHPLWTFTRDQPRPQCAGWGLKRITIHGGREGDKVMDNIKVSTITDWKLHLNTFLIEKMCCPNLRIIVSENSNENTMSRLRIAVHELKKNTCIFGR